MAQPRDAGATRPEAPDAPRLLRPVPRETEVLAPVYALIREIAERLRRDQDSGDERQPRR